MASMLEELELKEEIQKLIDNGYGELVDAFLEHEHEVTTKKGRLNKSGLGRLKDWKSKQIEDQLVEAKKLLKDDFPDWD
jgi:hypothetical protein